MGFEQFVNLREALVTKNGVVILREEVDMQCTLYSMLAYTFLTFFFCFLSTKICFSLFHFFFCDEISNIRNRILTIQKPEQISEIICGTVCVVVVSLTSDEWVYLFVSCPKLILVSRFKSNWWAQQGFGTWPNYKAPGTLLVELIMLLW